MCTLAPGRRQKAAKVRPDLRMKDTLLIKLGLKLQLKKKEQKKKRRGSLSGRG